MQGNPDLAFPDQLFLVDTVAFGKGIPVKENVPYNESSFVPSEEIPVNLRRALEIADSGESRADAGCVETCPKVVSQAEHQTCSSVGVDITELRC